MEEVTPSIYYMVSWLEESLKNKEEVYLFYNAEGAHPFYTPNDSTNFYIKVYLYDKFPKDTGWYWTEAHTHKIIVDFKFKFDDLTKGENILTRIKTRINEELEKNSCNLSFNTGFVKIIINYLILHPPNVGERMMKEFDKERD